MEKQPPQSQNGIIDSHAHVVREFFADDREEVIGRAKDSGMKALVNPGVVVDDCTELEELTATYDWIYAAAGQHPHEAKHWNDELKTRMLKALENPKFVAVGECGLDFHYNNSDRESQLRAFKDQIEIARDLNKPLIVHCRDAWEEAIDMIAEHGNGKVRGVFHCFTGNPDVVPGVKKLDFYVSYSGILTFSSAKDLQKTAPMLAADRILVETDCPFLAPQKVRGKRNEPSYVWWVAEKLAELRESTLDQVALETSNNTKELFGLP